MITTKVLPVADYDYLKKWISSKELRKIRGGENPTGTRLTRQQVWHIMKGISKNFEFRNYLVQVARRNESINS